MNTSTLLEQITQTGNPAIIQADGQYIAVFLYEGATAPFIVGDFNLWGADGPTAFTMLESDLWEMRVPLPADAYIEYQLAHDPTDESSRFNDPLNDKRTVYNGVGSYNNYFSMPDAPPAIRRKRGITKGKVSKDTIHNTMFIGGRRDIWFYNPPVDEQVPLIVVYDGDDYLNRGRITALVDNLIAAGTIRPVALAMVSHAPSDGRFTEYNHGETAINLLVRHVLPMAQEKFSLIDIEKQPGAFGILGASMGGLQSLYTALRLPHIFGKVISQSGAFLSFDGGITQPLIFSLIDTWAEPPPLKIWLDVGRMEFLHQPVLFMEQMLQDRGWDVTLLQYNSGHNYTAWSHALTQALPTLFSRIN